MTDPSACLAGYFYGVNRELEPCNRSFCILVAKKHDRFSQAFLPNLRFLDPFLSEDFFLSIYRSFAPFTPLYV